MLSNRHRQSGKRKGNSRRKGQAAEESASRVVHNLDSYPDFSVSGKLLYLMVHIANQIEWCWQKIDKIRRGIPATNRC